ncbi:MAG: ParB/RepB/Spo0J family partition protein [bacterium]|nr:ParB/RepB/Spo0J family partition protein [bacterium]
MQVELEQLELRYTALRIMDRPRVQRLVASICEQGQQTPVLVIRGEADSFVLIDGYARVEALRKLATDIVDAAVLELPEAEALVVGYRLDNTRQRSALEEGWILRELADGHGLGLEVLARKLDRSRSWVSRRLALVGVLPESVQHAIQQGRLSVQAATKYLVPLARANASQCEQLVEQLDGASISVRQMGRLYVAWREGTAQQRDKLCAHPKLFFQVEEATRGHQTATPDEQVTQAIKELGIIAGLCVRARRRLDEPGVAAKGERQQQGLERAFSNASEAFGSLSARLQESR